MNIRGFPNPSRNGCRFITLLASGLLILNHTLQYDIYQIFLALRHKIGKGGAMPVGYCAVRPFLGKLWGIKTQKG